MSPIATTGNIYWLASYPKSGNTWVRTFIASLLKQASGSVNMNELHLHTGAIASARDWVESALEFDIDELFHDEVDSLRPTACRWLSSQMQTPSFHKVHDAYIYLDNGEPLFPRDATAGALSIVRNPLDIAVSFAHHSGLSIDETIANMGCAKHGFGCGTNKLYQQLRQQLQSWSQHVSSWIDSAGQRKLVVRYEDMQQQPLKTFVQVAEFLGLPSNVDSVERALDNCHLKKLQSQERATPFKERPANVSHFFRKGIVGDWKTQLNEQQVSAIINDHKDMMLRLGYLDQHSKPCLAAYESLDVIGTD